MSEVKDGVSCCNKQLADLRLTNPNTLFIIARSKNLNIVVYEAILDGNGKLDKDKPVEVYWLDIDPEYVKKNRAKGINSDRSELNMVERQFAYGISWEAVSGEENAYRLKLVALPDRPVTVTVGQDGCKVHAKIEINGVQVEIERIYVHRVERSFRLPKVEYVDVEGVDENGNKIAEKIIPKA